MNKTGDSKWKQLSFIIDPELGLNSCSNTTLSNLENGKVVNDDKLYYDFAHRLHMEINIDSYLSEIVNEHINKIFISIENKDIRSLKICLEYLIKIMNKCKNFLYYRELRYAVNKIQDYYIHSKNLNYQEVSILKNLYTMYPNKMKDILKAIFYDSTENMEERNRIIAKYKISESQFIVNRIIALNHSTTNSFLEQYENCLIIEKEIISRKCNKWLLNLYIVMQAILYHIDKVKMEEVLKKLIFILEREELNEKEKAMITVNCGIAYTMLNQYDKSITYLEYLPMNKDNLMVKRICLCHSYVQRNGNIPEEYLVVNKGTYLDNNAKALLKYYLENDTRTISEKKMYLLKKVIPKIKKLDYCYITIIQTELLQLSILSNDFHYYGKFMKEFFHQ